MQKMRLYAILDEVSGLYSIPVAHINDNCAIRWFVQILNNDKVNPIDYSLFLLGEYDMNSAKIKHKKVFIKKVTAGEKVEVDINSNVEVLDNE